MPSGVIIHSQHKGNHHQESISSLTTPTPTNAAPTTRHISYIQEGDLVDTLNRQAAGAQQRRGILLPASSDGFSFLWVARAPSSALDPASTAMDLAEVFARRC
uniref:Uncharacterized protein n=1 Tax=Arundo donax TaxID=35708 RepID=A0A0A9FEW8_ARUDO